jgi:hypothetical protein
MDAHIKSAMEKIWMIKQRCAYSNLTYSNNQGVMVKPACCFISQSDNFPEGYSINMREKIDLITIRNVFIVFIHRSSQEKSGIFQ